MVVAKSFDSTPGDSIPSFHSRHLLSPRSRLRLKVFQRAPSQRHRAVFGVRLKSPEIVMAALQRDLGRRTPPAKTSPRAAISSPRPAARQRPRGAPNQTRMRPVTGRWRAARGGVAETSRWCEPSATIGPLVLRRRAPPTGRREHDVQRRRHASIALRTAPRFLSPDNAAQAARSAVGDLATPGRDRRGVAAPAPSVLAHQH